MGDDNSFQVCPCCGDAIHYEEIYTEDQFKQDYKTNHTLPDEVWKNYQALCCDCIDEKLVPQNAVKFIKDEEKSCS